MANNDNTSDSALFGGMELKTAQDEIKPETHEESSFSFLHETSAPVSSEQEISSFSFLASEQTDNEASAFQFLANGAKDEPALVRTAKPALSTLTEPVKFSKAVASKTVKKKKRASRVGFGRDDDGDGDESVEGNTPPPSPSVGTNGTDPTLTAAVKPSQQTTLPAIDETPSAISSMTSLDQDQDDDTSLSIDPSEHGPSATLKSVLNDKLDHDKNGNDGKREEVLHSKHADGIICESDQTEDPMVNFLSCARQDHQITLETNAVVMPTSALSELDVGKPPQPVQDVHSAYPSTDDVKATCTADSLAHSGAKNEEIPLPVEVSSSVASTVLGKEASAAQILKNSSCEVLKGMTAGLANLSHLHQKAVNNQQQLKTDIELETAAVNAAKHRLSAQELEQERLAELEEFDRADKLNTDIAATKADVHQRSALIDEMRGSAEQLEEHFMSQRAKCIGEFFSATRALTELQEKLQSQVEHNQNNVISRNAAEDTRLRAEIERIELEKKHIEREEVALQSERSGTEEAIKAQTGDFCDKKADLEARVFACQMETRQLEERLVEKRTEEAALSAELAQVDSVIGEVSRKYDRQLQRIKDRHDALLLTKSECLQEERTVLDEQEAINEHYRDVERANLSLERWTQSVGADISVAETLLSSLSPTVGNPNKHARSFSNFLSTSSLLASISSLKSSSNASIQECTQQLDDATDALKQASQEEAQLAAEQEILSAQTRDSAEQLNELEVVKKAHAAGKRFKEAAAAAKDIKELMAKRDEATEQLNQNSERAEELAKVKENLESACAAASKRLLEAQREQDLVRFESLVGRAGEVRAMRKVVFRHVKLRNKQSESVEQEQQQPVETGSSFDLCSATLSFLESELEALLSEAEQIRETYSLPALDSALVRPLNDDDDDHDEDDDEFDVTDEQSSEELDNGDKDNSVEVGAVNIDELTNECEKLCVEGALGCDYQDNSDGVDIITPDVLDEPVGATEVTESSGNDNVVYTEEGQGQQHGDADEERCTKMAAAKSLAAEIADLNFQLEDASDKEEYEQAAVLFEDISIKNGELDELLAELKCSREEIDCFREEADFIQQDTLPTSEISDDEQSQSGSR